jgi:hypothetical protein
MNKNNFTYNPEIEERWLKRLEDCLNSLSPQTVHRLKSFWHKDILVETPLFNIKGRNDALENMKHIFSSLNITKVKVVDMAISQTNPHVFYVRWEMKTGIKGNSYVISAMSEFTTDIKTNLIIHQQDFWNPDTIFQQLSGFYRFGWKRAVSNI